MVTIKFNDTLQFVCYKIETQKCTVENAKFKKLNYRIAGPRFLTKRIRQMRIIAAIPEPLVSSWFPSFVLFYLNDKKNNSKLKWNGWLDLLEFHWLRFFQVIDTKPFIVTGSGHINDEILLLNWATWRFLFLFILIQNILMVSLFYFRE